MRRWVCAAALATMPLAIVSGQPTPSLRWEPLQTGVTARLRGISAVSADVVWVSGADGTIIRTMDGGRTWQPRSVPGADALDFRDIEARDATTAVVMSAGAGAASRIYRTSDGGATWTLCYTAPDAAMFLDAMAFVDDAHGLVFSDSIDGHFVVLTTRDGGTTWIRVPADRLPPALPGEGAFAASGTNVAVVGTHVWIATTASRVLHSADRGQTWTVARTPLKTGEATGIFSIAFRDAAHGVVVGGAYTRETEAVDNVASTADGGRTWQGAGRRGMSGYRSVVVVAPSLGPATWLAIGPSGADRSDDDGRSWAPIGGDGHDAASISRDGSTLFASGSRGRVARVVLAR